MLEIDQKDSEPKQYLKYSKRKGNERIIRTTTARVLNSYLRKNLSINKFKKVSPFTVTYTPKDGADKIVSKPISFTDVEKHLTLNNGFDHNSFQLPEIKCPWLDGTTEVALHQHLVGNGGGAVKINLPLTLGGNFPINPTLDREGALFNSFQDAIAKRIISLHNRIVENSQYFQSADWLFDLLTLISNCISIVDITLNHLYIKAEFDPLKDWNFNEKKLGKRYGRRMTDKFKWVYQITGNHLDNFAREKKSFKVLKNIRNHTQHFDPPCFGFTLEEVANWLNMVNDIGSLLLKIRDAIQSPYNKHIIGILLLPNVSFHGKVLFDRKREAHNNVGYETTTWPPK
ncbi:MAG TPA: hypothetical protein VF181_00960 [Balneolaceae bacterium]